MARFSGPAEHGPRRAAVEAVLVRLHPATTGRRAGERTAERLARQLAANGRVEVIAAIARPAVVEALGLGLGVPPDRLGDLARDVEAIVEVIGRGRPGGAEADAATERLHARFVAHRCGPVAVISALYQSMDATAALVAATVLNGSAEESTPASVPIARTKRLAVEQVDVGATTIAPGTTVDLELGRTGLWFGAGPHSCPGRVLAEAIAASVVAAVDGSGATVDRERTVIDGDGRPSALWLRR